MPALGRKSPVRFQQATIALLEDMARKEDKTLSELIRLAVVYWFQQGCPAPEYEALPESEDCIQERPRHPPEVPKERCSVAYGCFWCHHVMPIIPAQQPPERCDLCGSHYLVTFHL